MLQPLTNQAQLVLGTNLYAPTHNAVYTVTAVGVDPSLPDMPVYFKRCGYDGTLVGLEIQTAFNKMNGNYLVIV